MYLLGVDLEVAMRRSAFKTQGADRHIEQPVLYDPSKIVAPPPCRRDKQRRPWSAFVIEINGAHSAPQALDPISSRRSA